MSFQKEVERELEAIIDAQVKVISIERIAINLIKLGKNDFEEIASLCGLSE